MNAYFYVNDVILNVKEFRIFNFTFIYHVWLLKINLCEVELNIWDGGIFLCEEIFYFIL